MKKPNLKGKMYEKKGADTKMYETKEMTKTMKKLKKMKC